ncbi:hypothetical protein BMS3Abin04_01162 [bacterium BMS3Abin04]|nr:hypothetical protein BMS3Abin04_01162 [bacterium BMS3Abin04]
MKTIKFIIFLILLVLLNYCSTEPGNDYVDFKIKVDSVAVPDTISVNDSLIIKFYGMVGTNGCPRFKYFKVF